MTNKLFEKNIYENRLKDFLEYYFKTSFLNDNFKKEFLQKHNICNIDNIQISHLGLRNIIKRVSQPKTNTKIWLYANLLNKYDLPIKDIKTALNELFTKNLITDPDNFDFDYAKQAQQSFLDYVAKENFLTKNFDLKEYKFIKNDILPESIFLTNKAYETLDEKFTILNEYKQSVKNNLALIIKEIFLLTMLSFRKKPLSRIVYCFSATTSLGPYRIEVEETSSHGHRYRINIFKDYLKIFSTKNLNNPKSALQAENNDYIPETYSLFKKGKIKK